jgi:autotransporter-associated beta strand protein
MDTASGVTATVSANLSGTSLTKTGAGTLTISGSKTYTGGTTVSGGTLNFSGTVPTSGNFSVSSGILALSGTGFAANGTNLTLSGGTLSLASANTFQFGTITISGNTTIDFGGSIGTTLQSTNLIIQNNAIVTVNNWVAGTDLWKSTNAPSVNSSTIASGGTVTGVNFTNYSGLTTSWTSSGVTANQLYPVPEPSTYGALMAAGCAGLISWRRRRSRREAAAKA